MPALISFVVLRLEIFSRVNYQQQCASSGIESFLCLLLIGYEIFSSRKRWGVPPTESADDPWRSIFDDLHDWFTGPRVTMVSMLTSACLFSLGTYLSTRQITRSTYICFSPLDSGTLTLLWQVLGLFLDAAIIILLWQILAWTSTMEQRLRVLAVVFAISAFVSAGLGLCSAVFSGIDRYDAFGSVHGFDLLVDSTALATFASCMGLWICETSPITPVSVMTFLAGTLTSSVNVARLGDWMHLSRAESLLPIWLIAFGTAIFTYSHDIRFVIFVQRSFLTFLLMAFLCVATIITFAKQTETFGVRHPINDLIYQAQTEHYRWLLKAATSQSLHVAIRVYEERHSGRPPPPYFSEWYQYAAGSLVIDDFKQIDQDLAPFWGFTPADLRLRASAMAADPGVFVITVKNGQVSRGQSGDESKDRDLNELIEMIQKFSIHLPDMVLPINLSPTPRILPSWEDVQLQSRADIGFVANFVSKRWLGDPNTTSGPLVKRSEHVSSRKPKSDLTRASDFRHMQEEACSPTSRARTRQNWNFAQFCYECVKGHSRGQLMDNFQQSLDVCSQPDLKHLHGFSLTDKRLPTIRQLVPLFGPSKTGEFKDVIIPLPRSRLERPDIPWHFSRRYDNLFWRGAVGLHELNGQELRGSHKFRLLHLLNRPRAQDRVAMILPAPGKNGSFGTELVSAVDVNRALPISAGMIDYSACPENDCEVVKHAFGTEADTEEALEYRYVLLTDEDDGPPGELLRTIRSGSVPFVSTLFRTWYTERLVPWLHFVPVDVRYQALHTTFSYFTGTKNRPKINGRETGMQGHQRDGEWISRRGQKWAEQAMSKKDMGVYLFRLLLEWGRLIDDRRGDIGCRRGHDGAFKNDDWTQQRETVQQT